MKQKLILIAALTLAIAWTNLATMQAATTVDDTDTDTDIPTLSTLYNLTVSPANGSTVKSISSFTVTFDDYSSINSMSYPYIYSDTEYSAMVTYCKTSVSNNVLTLTANVEVTDAGTYYIVIKSGKITLDGTATTTEDIVVTYTVDPNAEETDDGDDGDDEEEDADVEYTLSMITPEEGSEMESMDAGYTLQFAIEPASNIGYAYYKIGTTAGGGDISSRASLTYNSETTYWEGSIYYGFSLEKGDVYITAAAYASESDFNYGKDALVQGTFVITGTADPYEYSSATVESVSPENASSISAGEDLVVTITFTGDVNINSSTSFVNYGQGVTYAFRSITPSDEAEYSGKWALTVSTDILSLFGEGIDLSIVATDESGARVYDEDLSEGEDEWTYLHLYYEFSGYGLTDFTIIPAEGIVDSLSTFTLSYSGATYIAPTWNYYPTLYDSDGNVVKKITGNGVTYTSSEVVFNLGTTVTEEGTYQLVIPKKTVIVNDSFDSYNAEITYTYTIGGTSSDDDDDDDDDIGDGDDDTDTDDSGDTDGINGVTADSNGCYVVYSIAGNRITTTSDASTLRSLPAGIYIVNGKKMAVR